MANGAEEKATEKRVEPPEQRWHRSPNYRDIAPSWISCNVNYGLLELIPIISENNLTESITAGHTVVDHHEELCIRITPQTAKFLLIYLIQNLKIYEINIGHVKTGNDDIDKKVDEVLAKS